MAVPLKLESLGLYFQKLKHNFLSNLVLQRFMGLFWRTHFPKWHQATTKTQVLPMQLILLKETYTIYNAKIIHIFITQYLVAGR